MYLVPNVDNEAVIVHYTRELIQSVEMVVAEAVFLDTKIKVNKTKYVKRVEEI
jgi:hypothetical protein